MAGGTSVFRREPKIVIGTAILLVAYVPAMTGAMLLGAGERLTADQGLAPTREPA